ncbi:CDF family Co(II)/Ni(II) efflux transporter DmeF [Crenobacter intestini]|uniref:CDF family Co(II)/Ni(II) efflux transporter DmeF n=1 Tax=Crenobacter intestini TaxID=2563443 RepID=A0A4T0UP08_9NEIS|nr:CDF family Co(II)/Ni(II) efflux transporter DmeF [Crenobacter intestini]TIC80514.1 CDF family Co(II)/Ni(II) efflux transporter DmeF [Crenobacter intestini]
MQPEQMTRWVHDHVFDGGNAAAERGTRAVMWITAATMLVEVAAGWWFNSMALLADGWHMSSHALAIGLSAMAYAAARRYARDPRFAFGTWKIEILGGFASAIFLLGVAAMMVVGSVERFFSPEPIQYREAIAVAVLGLVVNVVCALILGRAHHHGHGHAHGHDHGHHHHGHDHHHHDLNLKSAYVHVIADAATSVLAIGALVGGWLYGWSWLDPAMGIVGAVLVGVWARGLIVETGKVLLDREMDHPVVGEIREVVEVDAGAGATRIVDLHVWRVGQVAYSCALTVVTRDSALTPDTVRDRLAVHEEVVHATIEVHHLPPAAGGAGA